MSKDIRLSTGFNGHPKKKKLQRRFKTKGASAVLGLIAVWCYAAENKSDGELTGVTAEDIAIIADWDGDAEEYTQALVEIGFIDLKDGTMSLHDWADHQPWIIGAKERSQKAKSAATRRWGEERETLVEDTQDATSMLRACGEHAVSMLDDESSNAPLPSSPILSSPSPTRTPRESTSQSPKGKKAPPKKADAPEWFDTCWEPAHKKEDKQGAIREAVLVEKAHGREFVNEVIVPAWLSYVAGFDARGDWQYERLFRTWLSKECWNDKPMQVLPGGKASSPYATTDEAIMGFLANADKPLFGGFGGLQ